MGMENGLVVPMDGVVGTQTGWAKVLTMDKIESKNRVNNFLAFILSIFLISEVVDVVMSGCFG